MYFHLTKLYILSFKHIAIKSFKIYIIVNEKISLKREKEGKYSGIKRDFLAVAVKWQLKLYDSQRYWGQCRPENLG